MLGFGVPGFGACQTRPRTRGVVCRVATGAGVRGLSGSAADGHAELPAEGGKGQEQKKNSRGSGGQRRRRRVPLSELHVGQELVGRVRNVVDYGAYVSVGATRDGLLHVRDMSVDFVQHPEDVLRVGDEIRVNVKYVDPENAKLAFTMIQRTVLESRLPLAQVAEGARYDGTIVRITNFGAYVDIGAEVDGFLHVTQLWGDSKRDTLETLRFGERLEVVVAEVSASAHRIGLALATIPEQHVTRRSMYGRSTSRVAMEKVLERPNAPRRGDDFDLDEWDATFEGDNEADIAAERKARQIHEAAKSEQLNAEGDAKGDTLPAGDPQ